MKKIKTGKNHMAIISKNLFMILLLVATVLPFILIISASFSSQSAIDNYGYQLIPKEVTLDGYKYIMQTSDQIIKAYVITIFITAAGTILSLMMNAMAAYPLSRKDFLYRRQVNMFVFIPTIISGGIVPTYILITKYLHMADTIWVLFVPALANVSRMFLLRTFFANIPDSLIEAAKIEGASEMEIFFKIALPLVKTGLATVAIFLVLQFWNEWFTALLYMNSNKYITLQLLLNRIMENLQFLKRNPDIGMAQMMAMDMPETAVSNAMVIVTAGPTLIVFPFFQKYFVKGITVGSVKG